MKKSASRKTPLPEVEAIVLPKQTASDTERMKELVEIRLEIRRAVSFTIRGGLVTLTGDNPRLVVKVSDLTQEIRDKVQSKELSLSSF